MIKLTSDATVNHMATKFRNRSGTNMLSDNRYRVFTYVKGAVSYDAGNIEAVEWGNYEFHISTSITHIKWNLAGQLTKRYMDEPRGRARKAVAANIIATPVTIRQCDVSGPRTSY